MGMARKSLARSARLGLRRIGMAQQRFHYEVNGSVLETGDEILDGRQIRSSAQLAPPSAFALVRTDEGIGQAIGLEEEVRLAPGATARFQAFESDRIFTFTVDERGWEWGTDEIAEAEIRRIAAIPDHRELFLDSDQDQPIPHGGKIRLSGKRSEEHTSELQSLMRISYAVFCLKKKTN